MMLNTATSTSEADFLNEVRMFLSEALTPDLREAGRNTTGVHSDIAACKIWHRRLFERGWIAPAWPKSHGGANWTAAQRFLFERECAANDAPILFATGQRSLGPLLIAMGTPEQQRRYLPAILNGDDLWCQGFSEPGAGSDLAALKTQAVAQGEHYLVNGSKIWTTGAQFANRMFCLVRTSSDAKRQNGITFLLIDMASPGITIRPIQTIAGEPEFNEVFFDDVRVPMANRVGEENDGWGVAKQLMSFARANNTTSGQLRRAFRRATCALDVCAGAEARAARLSLGALEAELRSFEAIELLLQSGPPTAGVSEAQASMLKTLATELHQKITAFAVDTVGPAAVASAGLGNARSPWHDEGSFAVTKYLATRAASIYSGTNETHRNLIARHMLGL